MNKLPLTLHPNERDNEVLNRRVVHSEPKSREEKKSRRRAGGTLAIKEKEKEKASASKSPEFQMRAWNAQ